MRVEQCKHGLSECRVGKGFIGSFRHVLYRIRQELKLVNQVREQWLVNLSEFELPLRQMPQNLVHNRGSDGQRAAIYEIHNFRHAPESSCRFPQGKEKSRGAFYPWERRNPWRGVSLPMPLGFEPAKPNGSKRPYALRPGHRRCLLYQPRATPWVNRRQHAQP